MVVPKDSSYTPRTLSALGALMDVSKADLDRAKTKSIKVFPAGDFLLDGICRGWKGHLYYGVQIIGLSVARSDPVQLNQIRVSSRKKPSTSVHACRQCSTKDRTTVEVKNYNKDCLDLKSLPLPGVRDGTLETSKITYILSSIHSITVSLSLLSVHQKGIPDLLLLPQTHHSTGLPLPEQTTLWWC